MIVKKVTKKKGNKSDFKNLINYLMREGKTEGTIEYNRISNCGFDDIGLATKEVQATQIRNTRSKADKTCHLVVSFPAGEHPTNEQLIDIENEICRSIGYTEHQRISVLHTDTDNIHLHIAINKIHPKTHKIHESLRDHYRLSDACAELEQRHGLQKDNRAEKGQHVIGKAGDMEAHTGIDSFKRWISSHSDQILKGLDAVTQWEELHKHLASFDLELRKRGAGFIISSRSEKAFTKASDLGGSFSKKQLEARLGSFTKGDTTSIKPKYKYQKAPQSNRHSTASLWELFQQDKQLAAAQKREQLENLRAKQTIFFEVRKDQKQQKFQEIKRDNVLSTQKKRTAFRQFAQQHKNLLLQDKQTFKHQRQSIHQQHPTLTWQAWLIKQASDGNDEALTALRSAIRKPTKGAAQFAFLGQEQSTQLSGQKPIIRANGDKIYQIQNSKIRDTGDSLLLEVHDKQHLATAIELARKKYGDYLQIEGNDAFKQEVVEFCVQTAQPVQFQDPSLERRRQVLTEVRETQLAQKQIFEWIERENKKRAEVPEAAMVKLFEPKDRGPAIFLGVEAISASQSVALYQRKDMTLVVPVRKNQIEILKRRIIKDTQVTLGADGFSGLHGR